MSSSKRHHWDRKIESVVAGRKEKGDTHRVLETGKARIVSPVDLALVVDHCEELVVVQCLWARIAAHARKS